MVSLLEVSYLEVFQYCHFQTFIANNELEASKRIQALNIFTHGIKCLSDRVEWKHPLFGHIHELVHDT